MGTCVAVTLYNIAQGQGVIIGDSVAIPEPYVTKVNFTLGEEEEVGYHEYLIANHRVKGSS